MSTAPLRETSDRSVHQLRTLRDDSEIPLSLHAPVTQNSEPGAFATSGPAISVSSSGMPGALQKSRGSSFRAWGLYCCICLCPCVNGCPSIHPVGQQGYVVVPSSLSHSRSSTSICLLVCLSLRLSMSLRLSPFSCCLRLLHLSLSFLVSRYVAPSC